MSTPETMTNCPSEETLAAFIDGRLDAEARRDVMEHIMRCDDCRSIVTATWDFQAESQGTRVVRGRFGVAALLAAAAVVAFVLLYPPLRYRLFRSDGIPALAEASGSLQYRPVEGRPIGDFPYKPPFPRLRSDDDRSSELLPLYVPAAKIEQRAQSDSSVSAQRALGVAQLLLRKPEQAMMTLEDTLKKQTEVADVPSAIRKSDDVELLTALAIAYLERGEHTQLAIDAAERAWSLRKTPETAWNRALAHDHPNTDTRDRARAVWQDYLALDANSPWADEARRNIERLSY